MNAVSIHHPIRRPPSFLNRIGKVTGFVSVDCSQDFSVFLNHDLLYPYVACYQKKPFDRPASYL